MQKNSAHQPGKPNPFQADCKRNTAKPVLRADQEKDHNPTSFGGLDILTDISLQKIILKKKTIDLVHPLLTEKNTRHILAQAKNYAKQNRLKLSVKTLKNYKDVETLIRELHKKISEVGLFVDKEKDELDLRLNEYITKEHIYYIPIKQTYDMRPEMGLLARRFIKAFANKFKIHDITDTYHFQMEVESASDEIEYQKHKLKEDPKFAYLDDEELTKQVRIFLEEEYPEATMKWNEGEPSERLAEFNSLTPLTLEELLSFKTVSKKERDLVNFFKKGFEVMKVDIDIWQFSESYYMTNEQMQEINECGEFVCFESMCCINYDNDDAVTHYIIDMIDCALQGGGYIESLMLAESVPETGNTQKADDIYKVINYIYDFESELKKAVPDAKQHNQ